jgi:hypothetical protein
MVWCFGCSECECDIWMLPWTRWAPSGSFSPLDSYRGWTDGCPLVTGTHFFCGMKKLKFKGSQLRSQFGASRRLPKHSDDVYGIFPVVIRLTLTCCKVSAASLRSPLVTVTPQVLNGGTALPTTLRKTNEPTPAFSQSFG